MNLGTGVVDEMTVKELIRMFDPNNAVAKALKMVRDWCSINTTYNPIVGDFGHSGTTRDVLIERKSGGLQQISELHPLYMTLQYPILLPYGRISLEHTLKEQHRKAADQEGKRHKKSECSIAIVSNRGIEDQRLTWIRYHQDELRADVYNNIVDLVNNGDTNVKSIGKRIVLLATYTGNPRYIMQSYQDAMALCRSFGNPCLFITFTANPKWPEVTEMLSYIPRRAPHERLDIMTRVFKLKLKQLSKNLKKHMIFGKTQAYAGLPHAHILLWLQRKSKTPSAAEIDDIISAAIHYSIKYPKAHKLVTEHMMHGPCGTDNMKSPYMINRECNKHFPKSFYSRAIKYLFKYISKGSDEATTVVVHNSSSEDSTGGATCFTVVEIKIHLNCCYLSSCKAIWRIYGFDIHSCVPLVIKLPLHLPESNTVMVRDSQNLESVLRRDGLILELEAARIQKFLEILFGTHQLRRGSGEKLKGNWSNICNVTNPRKVWDDNWDILSEDVLYKKRREFRFPTLEFSENPIKNYCLVNIEEVLATNGKSLEDFPEMPLPDKSVMTDLDNRLIQEEMSYNITMLIEEHQNLHESLNDEQGVIYDKVIVLAANHQGGMNFGYGVEAIDKTFLYRTIMARLRSERHISWRIAQNTNLAKLMHRVSLIIWDEAPMTQRHAFEALNRTLQDIQGILDESNRKKILGGITMLLGEDFRQILRVISKRKHQDRDGATINNSPLWSQCQLLTLSQCMRVNAILSDGSIDANKQKFNEWVLKVGDGEASTIAIDEYEDGSWIEIPEDFIIQPRSDPIHNIINVIYRYLDQNKANPEFL
ncbi:LOW QUALITY PROTEIN: hypothetical protein V2J09_006134 [Rumex salicifolius]